MKKIFIIASIVIFVILAILFLPIPKGSYDDGGTRDYDALLYKIVVWNRIQVTMNEDGSGGDPNIYHKTSVFWYPDNQKKIDELWKMEMESKEKALVYTDPVMLYQINYDLGELKDCFTDTPQKANSGKTVEIKTTVLYDAGIHVYIDGSEIEKTHYDSDYWGFSFIMPGHDVTVTAKPYTKNEIYGTDSDFTWVKEAYYRYLKENHLLDTVYGPKDASDLFLQTYVGTFGDGCVVAYMGGDALCFTEALRPERYGDNTIVFRDGQICHAFYNNETHTIGEAYENGFLTDEDILIIKAAVGCMTEQNEQEETEFFEEMTPYDAQLEIVCANEKLVFSRIATTPRVRAGRPPFDETCITTFEDKHEIVTELFRILNGKEAIAEYESLPTLQLLLYGQNDDEPWHYLFEFSEDGLVRVSNNAELLCCVQISEDELNAVIHVLD